MSRGHGLAQPPPSITEGKGLAQDHTPADGREGMQTQDTYCSTSWEFQGFRWGGQCPLVNPELGSSSSGSPAGRSLLQPPDNIPMLEIRGGEAALTSLTGPEPVPFGAPLVKQFQEPHG